MAKRKEAAAEKPQSGGPWSEIFGLIMMGIGFVVLLALISYHSDDPSWNSTGGAVKARNWVGPLGAKMADWLYQAFGFAALIVPLMLFVIGRWQWQQDDSDFSKPKVFGLFLMIVAMTGAVTMIAPKQPSAFYWGGFVGQWLMYGPWIGLARMLGNLGGLIGLIIIFTTGLLLGTDYTLIGIVTNLFKPPDQRQPIPKENRFSLKKTRQPQQRTDTVDDVQPERVIKKFAQRKQTVNGRPPVRISWRPPTGALVANGADGAPSEEEFDPATARQIQQVAPLPPQIVAHSETAQPARAVPVSGNGAATRGGRKPPPPVAKRARPDDDLDDAFPLEEPPEDFADGFAGERTVDEMMETASVKRADPADAAAEPTKKGAGAKLSEAVKKITRTANFKLPSTEMLTPPAPKPEMEEAELMDRARLLAEKCNEFHVSGQVKQISPGPVVTTFEFKPDPGVKYSRITGLVDDLCLGLKAESVRIDRIPGKSTVGIEVPNDNREVIRLREVLESKRFHDSRSKLTLALGKTIDGGNYVADLAKMPHLLIAGATGAGKSVALNTILVSLLYKAGPEEVKMILVDPKRLELGLYGEIPHLLTPIVTDPKRASYALKWAVSEMENRYKHLAQFGVRNIEQYNTDVCGESKKGKKEPEGVDAPQPLPYIVVVIDELADLMMVSARDVEESITRLAQMARAVGIHLVLATQRPSVDVITGLIKANFPSRISFRVSSKIDSRTIIDSNGAEQLLGQGDMLFLPPGTSRLVRVHGAYVDEKEVKRICDFVRSQANPDYDEKIVMSEKEMQGDEFNEFKKDEKYDEAVRVVIEMGRASTSALQRRLRIGYGRAASIIDMMEHEGIVGPEDGSKPRQVLVKADFLERLDQIREEGA